jgi:hypothetical protein
VVPGQSVFRAIERGTLTAYYIRDDHSDAISAIVITEASALSYLRRQKSAA